MKFDDSFKRALEKRAKSVPDEITDEALEVASLETAQECEGKIVKSRAMMDFAIIRLKVYLKIALSEEDIVLLKSAMDEIKGSPAIGETKIGTTVGYTVV